jgi:hypothetical protein
VESFARLSGYIVSLPNRALAKLFDSESPSRRINYWRTTILHLEELIVVSGGHYDHIGFKCATPCCTVIQKRTAAF